MIPTNTIYSGLLTAYDQASKGTWSKKEYEEYLKVGMKKGIERDQILYALEKGMEKGMDLMLKKSVINGFQNGFSVMQLSKIFSILTSETENIIIKYELKS